MVEDLYGDLTDGFKDSCYELLRKGYKQVKDKDSYSRDWKEEDFTQQIVKEMKRTRSEENIQGYVITWNGKTSTSRTLASSFDPDEASKVDIKVDRFRGKELNYFIECKRIDESADLIRKYFKKGVKRFVDGKYAESFSEGAMGGFLITDEREGVVEKLKQKVQEYDEILVVEGMELINRSEDIGVVEEYESKHNRRRKLPRVTIRHFILEFS